MRHVELLARRHTKALCAIAIRNGLGADDAVEAVQEAFIAFLGLPQVGSLSEAETFTFLAVVVKNASRNLRRRHHRSRPHLDVSDISLIDEGLPTDELIAEAEVHVALFGCLKKLAEVQRRVVSLRMLEEMSNVDVAEILGIAPGHVAVLLHRAKAGLRLCLGANRDGEPQSVVTSPS